MNVSNPFERMATCLDQIAPFASRHLPEGEGVMHTVRREAMSGQIKIMLFGAYNAGKSTLINVLLGQEIARMDDIPTTDSVTSYPWGGHVLFDTPGLNAPMAHTRISEAKLLEADLVLFIIRQGDQDVQGVYDRLLSLVERKRHVFVLLNHEATSSEDLEALCQRFNSLLLRTAQARHIPFEAVSEIPFLALCAATALKGRLQGKKLLLQASGYDEFIERFNQWLSQYEDEQQRLELAKDVVRRLLLEPLSQVMEASRPRDEALSVLDREMERMAKEKSRMRIAAERRIRLLVDEKREALTAALDSATSEEDIRAAVDLIVEELEKSISQWLAAELEEFQAMTVQLSSLQFSQGPEGDDGTQFGRVIGDVFSEAAKTAATPENLSTLFHQLRKFKLPFFKGRWSSTLSKWAGKAAPLLQLLIDLIFIFISAKKENEMNQKAREAMLRKQQLISEIVLGLVNAFNASVVEVIDAFFVGQTQPLEQRRMEILVEIGEAESERTQFDELKATIESLDCTSGGEAV